VADNNLSAKFTIDGSDGDKFIADLVRQLTTYNGVVAGSVRKMVEFNEKGQVAHIVLQGLTEDGKKFSQAYGEVDGKLQKLKTNIDDNAVALEKMKKAMVLKGQIAELKELIDAEQKHSDVAKKAAETVANARGAAALAGFKQDEKNKHALLQQQINDLKELTNAEKAHAAAQAEAHAKEANARGAQGLATFNADRQARKNAVKEQANDLRELLKAEKDAEKAAAAAMNKEAEQRWQADLIRIRQQIKEKRALLKSQIADLREVAAAERAARREEAHQAAFLANEKGRLALQQFKKENQDEAQDR
jgi:hypothetical protein